MSHIIKTEEDLYKLNYLYKRLDLNRIDKDLITEIIDFVIPKDNNNKLITYCLEDESFGIRFVPARKNIDISLNKLDEWIKQNEINLDIIYDCGDKLNKYLVLFVILHEVEHSYQYLIGQGVVASPCELVKNAYKRFMDLMIDDNFPNEKKYDKFKRNIKLSLYHVNHDKYFIERNANVEALSDILNLTLINDDKKATAVFSFLLNDYMCLGYNNDAKGNIYYTYKKLHMIKEFNSYPIFDIKEEDRIRYGLEIDEENRKDILIKRNCLRKMAKK